MKILAFDPGFSGAWAVIIDGRPSLCGDMPVAGEGPKQRVQAAVLAHLIRGELPDLCVVELASVRPVEARSTCFRYGQAYGAVVAIVGALGIPIEIVSPALWKLHHRLKGPEKEPSRQRALELCPWLADGLRRRKDHNRAEAVLLGLYAHSTWGHRYERAAA